MLFLILPSCSMYNYILNTEVVILLDDGFLLCLQLIARGILVMFICEV